MCLSCYGQWQYFGVKQLQWEKSQAISNVRPKKKGRGRGGKKKRQEIALYCMQVHRQEAWAKYLLPVQVLVTAFGLTFGMLDRSLSKLVKGIKRHMWQKTLETTGPCCGQLTATSCAGARWFSAWAWSWDQGFPRSTPAAHGLWPLHTLSFHQVFSCTESVFQSRVLAT